MANPLQAFHQSLGASNDVAVERRPKRRIALGVEVEQLRVLAGDVLDLHARDPELQLDEALHPEMDLVDVVDDVLLARAS